VGKKHPRHPDSKFRSKYETEVAANLSSQSFQYDYELTAFKYHDPIVKGVCLACGSKHVAQHRTYTPDFALKNATGNVAFVIETKGLFTAENRRTALLMKQQHPTVDVRMLFMRNNKLHKSNPKTYGDWCDKQGIPWLSIEDFEKLIKEHKENYVDKLLERKGRMEHEGNNRRRKGSPARKRD